VTLRQMKLRERAQKLQVELPAVFFALKERKTPVSAKILAGITVCYALSPIDLIPDFIPVFGYLDDLIILPALIAWTVSLIPDGVMSDCREKARSLWGKGKPKRWYYAIPAVLVWLLILWLVVKAVFF